MLLLQASRDALLKPLQTVTGIVERRSTMPILSNVLLENRGGYLSFLGSDLEIQIRTQGPQNDMPEFRLTANARKLQDILRAIADTADVAVIAEESQIVIKAGKGQYKLQTLPAEQFPMMNIEEEVSACFTVRQEILRQMLTQVQYAIAVQDIRFYLTGMLMQVDGAQLRLVATDGHRLAYVQSTIDADLPAAEVILPRKTVLELIKLLTFPEEPVTVEFLHNQIRFRVRETVVVSKIVEGKFPDYARVIPQDNDKIFRMNRANFLTALERVAILASDKFPGATLKISPGLMNISCVNNDQEKAQEEWEIAYTGSELEMSFNIQYLTDILRNVQSEDVQMALGDSARSALITLPDRKSVV